ncbi:MAG: hypothetical protein Kow00108_23260 [Calditrichia bacterium]
MQTQTLIKFLIMVNLSILFCLNCSSSTGPDETQSSIRGKVLTPEGNPVSNAIIELSFNTLRVSKKASNFSEPTPLTIQYTVPRTGKVKLWISRQNSADTVITLVDEIKATGIYKVSWDGRNKDNKYVISGVYIYHLEFGTAKKEKEVLYLREYSDNDTIGSLEYFARTNKNGEFVISQDQIPFGYQFLMTDDSGNELGTHKVTRQVTIWALHQDYSLVSVHNVNVDPEKGADVILQFQ